jgi:hypothetical protein
MQMKETDIFSRIVTGDESWLHHYQPKSKRASVQWKHPSSPSTISWEGYSYRILGFSGSTVSPFSEACENVNSASYCEVLVKLRDAIPRKRPG